MTVFEGYEDEFGEGGFDSKHFEYMKRLIDLNHMIYVEIDVIVRIYLRQDLINQINMVV